MKAIALTAAREKKLKFPGPFCIGTGPYMIMIRVPAALFGYIGEFFVYPKSTYTVKNGPPNHKL